MMFPKLILFVLFAGVAAVSAAELGDYTIVVASDATEAERNAARELAATLRPMLGRELPIATEPGPRNFFVGPGAAVRTLCPGVDFDAMDSDEILVRRCGDDLVLAGGRPRGTLYAVYDFLEQELGVRWWSSTATVIPTAPHATLPEALDRRYNPPIRDRNAMFFEPCAQPRFGVKLRQNGFNTAVGSAWGGNYSPLGFVHTMGKLLPQETYFVSHPEYYALRDGKRSPDQLCLSNPEVRRILAESALQWLRAANAPTAISISQNDNENYCCCPECAAFDAREGSPAGLMVETANAVADAIAAEFPNVIVETLAYQYTRRPPQTIVPRPNVRIRLCTIECDMSRPLNNPANAAFARDLEDWSRIAPQLAVWDYVADFSNYLMPFPNWDVLAANLRLFRDHRVTSVLAQGPYNAGTVGDLPELKNWMISKLLWNPDADPDALRREFLTGYYGAAAPYLDDYIRRCSDALSRWGRPLPIWTRAPEFLTTDDLAECVRLFDAAQKAVAADPELSRRVRLARFAVDFALIYRYGDAVRHNRTWPVADMRAFAENTLREALAAGALQQRESGPMDAASTQNGFRNLVRQCPLPDALQSQTAAESAFDIQDILFLSDSARRIDDPAAGDGSAWRFDGSAAESSANASFAWSFILPDAKYHLYAVVKADGAPDPATVLQIGCLDTRGWSEQATGITAGEIAGPAYRTIDLGVYDLSVYCSLFIRVSSGGSARNIDFDRLIVIPVENQP